MGGSGMKILGISGLENSIPYKRTTWPGLEEQEYRIAQGMDAAAALLVDGRLIAAAEQERFSGKKHTGDFPLQAIQYCLAEAGLTIEDIDQLAHGFDYAPYRDLYQGDEVSAGLYREVFSRDALLKQCRRDLPGFPEEKIFSVGHHLAHAASAAFTSGWDECLVVVNDAMGEVESLSVYDFHDGELESLRQLSANDSIGILYSLVTLHLGFDFNSDEYKIMGLAPYGDPEPFPRLLRKRSGTSPMARFEFRSSGSTVHERSARTYSGIPRIPGRAPGPAASADATHHCDSPRCRGGPAGVPGKSDPSHLPTFCRGDRLAAHRFGRRSRPQLHGQRQAGRSGIFEEVYVQPVAGDDGVALGAALYRASLCRRSSQSAHAGSAVGTRILCWLVLKQALHEV